MATHLFKKIAHPPQAMVAKTASIVSGGGLNDKNRLIMSIASTQ